VLGARAYSKQFLPGNLSEKCLFQGDFSPELIVRFLWRKKRRFPSSLEERQAGRRGWYSIILFTPG
jgi:hypothetical protein